MSYNKKLAMYKMGDRLFAVIADIPVYPQEAYLSDLAHKYGYKKTNLPLPAECPIAEDEGRACFVDAKSKEEYLNEIRSYKESRRA